MKSKAANVDEYLKEASQKRILALRRIRELCKKLLPDHEESMSYSMPSYSRNGQVEVAFASQSKTINVYFLIHEVMLNNKDRLKGLNYGKGCIRFSNPDVIDYNLITHLMKQTRISDDRICS